jgi:hypothetical protein
MAFNTSSEPLDIDEKVRDWVKKNKSKESCHISKDVCDAIKHEFQKEGKQIKDLDPKFLKNFLKKYFDTQNHDHSYNIINLPNGAEIENHLRIMFFLFDQQEPEPATHNVRRIFLE